MKLGKVFTNILTFIGVVFVVLVSGYIGISAAKADTQTNPGGNGPPGFTCTLANIPAASTLVTLVQPSNYVTIVNTSSSTTLFFSATSPATVSSFPIVPNSAYSYGGVKLSNFYVIGSAASGTYGVIAH